MKKFLKYLSAVTILIISLMYLSDFVYTYVYANANPRNKFQYILKLEPQKIDYVFLGSSRTANHIVTSDIWKLTGKTAINLGIEGANLDDNLLELKLLMDRKIKMEKVFLQVDYIYETSSISNIANSEALPFIHHPIIKAHLKPKIAHFNEMYYIPFYRYLVTDFKLGYREFVFSLMNKKPKIALNDGFLPKIGTDNLNSFKLPLQPRKKNETMESIIKLCRDQHIDLVLFCAPFCSKAENLNYIDKLAKQLPNFHNYSKTMTDDNFYNCSHLNDKGAQKFTQMLVDSCLVNKTKAQTDNL